MLFLTSFLSGKEKFAHQGRLVFAMTPELLKNQEIRGGSGGLGFFF